ncbi:MAG: hypothetical protein E7667_00355 [Ruminococcaceae bacterium]|nr:hypothetical protein [Oscillospiraceae bacterium]
MKPSERRALREQKRQENENAEINRTSHSQEGTAHAPRKEGFIQSHIRLITFIICMVILVWIVFPISIAEIVKKFSKEEDLPKITLDYVCNVSEIGEEIQWLHFEDYSYNDMSYKTDGVKYIKREYPIKGTGLVLWVGGASDEGRPDYVYIVDMEYGTPHIDIRKDSVDEFLKKVEQAKEESHE